MPVVLTPLMLIRCYEQVKAGEELKLSHDWEPLTNISKELGASTISQQTAKNVFLWPGRSWVRKGFEVYFTALIELMWPKERIMEVYLNSIEMGNGIYGAQAVAEEHFNTDAKDLTKAQCALIAATLPNPRKFSSKYVERMVTSRTAAN